MKQTISAAGTPVPASVKAGTIFSWTAVSRVYNSLPNKFGIVKFMSHLCSATTTYRHCKRAGLRIIEGIGSSIIIRTYILDICGCRKLGLYRAAFFYLFI